jgi:hypothetical protein
MNLKKDDLRLLKIINAFDYALGNPSIFYRTQETGRVYRSASWMIHWPGHQFKGHWMDYGDMPFDLNDIKRDKELKLIEAQEKFKELFSVNELEKTPFGTWMDKAFVDKRNDEIKQQLKELKVK